MTRLINVLIVMGVVAVVITFIFSLVSALIVYLEPPFIYIPLGVFVGCGMLVTAILFFKMLFNIE